MSPIETLVTPSPIDSTMALASWPRIEGNKPSGSQPSKVYTSVWHKALDNTLTRTSPALGGWTWISQTSRGYLGPQATAALHVIT